MGKIMFNGVDYSAPSTAGVTGVKGDAETAYRTGNVNVTSDNIGALSTTGDASNTTTTFTQASARTNLTTKEKLSVSLGKITKWFADLKNVAFTGSASDLTTGTLSSARLPSATSSILGGVKITASSAVTNSNGLALAATEKNASIDGTLANQISTLNNNLTSKLDFFNLSNYDNSGILNLSKKQPFMGYIGWNSNNTPSKGNSCMVFGYDLVVIAISKPGGIYSISTTEPYEWVKRN